MKVAAIQLSSTADRAANMAVADRLTRAAAADGASLIVLPEKWTAMGAEADLRAAAEPLDGPSVEWACALAGELGVDLVAGSILEVLPGREKLANTSVHVDPEGRVRAVYRKIHMFDVDIAGRSYRESELEEPGSEIVLSETRDGVQLGMSICYDLRFPELFRILAVKGARVVVMPAAFTLQTTGDHWETLVRARAIENQVFMVAANQVGAHPAGQHSGGRSMIVDPWGVVLAEAPGSGEQPGGSEGYVTAELDLERQQEIRCNLPSLANRRPSAYAWPEEVRA
ncbi:MAG TPA: carbon-nitrogen hydrolase family protein [Solirubrobacteraceae bacterium]|nr:carbon-nitrogen hydrolase family protein [Solirubrobacteraceae bacterium]